MYTFPLIGTADPPVPNRCEICGATFADKDLLKGHLLIHLEERPLPWEMHQIGIISRVIQPPTDIQKPIPVQPPALRDPKKRTVGVVHQTDGFMCDICGSHFTSLSGMTRHRQKHLNSEPPKDRKHRCTQCGYSTDNIANLVAHVRAHTGERPFRCEVCDKRFSRKNTLLSHQLVHSDERPFKCEVCGKSYKSERTLISHERKHAPFTCDVCGESFAFLRFLKSHEQRQHSKDTGKAAEDSSTKCDVCGQGFSSPSELQAHQPSCHLRDGSFQCPHCPFSTDVRGSLNAHVRRMHVGERRHPQAGKVDDLKCEVCGQIFSSHTELQGHQRKHRHLPREGTFQCPHCPFSTDMKGHLNAHVRRSHVGERRHECKVCGKAFFEANKLNRHLRTHSGKCVFVCSTCGLNFTDWGAWREHEKSHAGWEIFSCPLCGRVFLKASDLRDHERDHLEGRVTTEAEATENQTGGKKKGKKDAQEEKEEETGQQHKCGACSSLFSSAADLKRHQRRLRHGASRAADFKCGQCSFSTDKKPCLVAHERRMHGGERSHLCEVCGRAFFEACKLKRHLRLHSGERPFVCVTCGKGFVGGTELRRHERLHSGVLPYACGFCSKRFQLLYKLKNHEHKHRVLEPLLLQEEMKGKEEGGKKEKVKGGKKGAKRERKIGKKNSFECKVCNSPFSTLSALVRHKRTMHEKRKHRCRRCFYATLHRSCLVAHMRIHLHRCELCDKTFAQKLHLDAHLRNHTDPKIPSGGSKKSPSKTLKPALPKQKPAVEKITGSTDEKGSKETDPDDFSPGSNKTLSKTMKPTLPKQKPAVEKIDTQKPVIEKIAGATDKKESNETGTEDKTASVGLKKSPLKALKLVPEQKPIEKIAGATTDEKGSKETDPGDFSCSGCGKGLGSSAELQKHILEEHMIQELSETADREKETGKEADERLASASEQLKKILEQATAETDKDKEIGVFKCDTCDRIFSTLFSLKKHLKSHEKEKILGQKTKGGGDQQKYHCPLCDYSAAFMLSLKYHLRTHFGPPKIAPKETPSEGEKKKKEGEESPKKPKLRSSSVKIVVKTKKKHQCGECSYSTMYASNLKVHVRNKHGTERPFPCPSCPKRFKDPPALRSHQRTHSAEKPHACDQCNKRFKHASSLRNHECSPDAKPSAVPEPSKESNEVEKVKEIQDIVLNDDCKCETCDKLLRALNEHRRTHLQPKQQPPALRVEEPPKKLPRPPPKKRVATAAQKPRRLHCSQCNYSTLYRTNFKVHQKRHIKQKVFKCSVCADLFTTQSAFTCHKKSHPELQSEFSHRCSECDFSTTSERKLATHVDRIHLGKRPHQCTQCKKGFFQLDELKRHMRFHTGERPFACNKCDKRFTIRGHLTIHERTHLAL